MCATRAGVIGERAGMRSSKECSHEEIISREYSSEVSRGSESFSSISKT